MAGWTGVTGITVESQTHNTLWDPSHPPTVLQPVFVSLHVRDPRMPYTNALFVFLFRGVALKPWHQATQALQFPTASKHTNPVSSAFIFLLYFPPSAHFTPTYTDTHTLTNKKCLYWCWSWCWSWRCWSDHTVWTQLFQSCGQVLLSLAPSLCVKSVAGDAKALGKNEKQNKTKRPAGL